MLQMVQFECPESQTLPALFQYIGKGTEKGGRDPKIAAKRKEKWGLILEAFNEKKREKGRKDGTKEDLFDMGRLKRLRNRQLALRKEEGSFNVFQHFSLQLFITFTQRYKD